MNSLRSHPHVSPFGLRNREAGRSSPSKSQILQNRTQISEQKSSPKHAIIYKKTSLSLTMLLSAMFGIILNAISGPMSEYNWMTGSASETNRAAIQTRGGGKSSCYVYYAPSSGKSSIVQSF